MLTLSRWAELDISAASGLVATADALHVVADDELFLASYDHDGTPRSRLPLFSGALPEVHAARKRQKPDLEALTVLPGGMLLAFGSGSTPARRRAALIDVAAGRVTSVDLAPLYAALERTLPELNIEGAAVLGDRLWLAQRGNGQQRMHALVELDLAHVLDSLALAPRIGAEVLCRVHPIVLGDIEGVPLSITDLTAHPDAGLLFSASAEASPDTYEDGVCVGSGVGLLSTDGRVIGFQQVDTLCKLEGIAVGALSASSMQLWLVADPDNRARRAPLYRATLPR